MEKYFSTKHKLDAEAIDDSFEIFQPNKLKKKNQTSNFSNNGRKKKFSPNKSSLSSSNSSQESFNTDMDNVMAVCLSKGDDASKLSYSGNKQICNKNWKELTHKMKGQPLLLTRTPAEREAILSQKLALILIEENYDISTSDKCFSLINMEDIQSDKLLDQWCKTFRLWSASIKPSEKIEDFYIKALANFVNFDELYSKNFSTKKISMDVLEKSERMENFDEELTIKNTPPFKEYSLLTGVTEEVESCKKEQFEESSADMFESFETTEIKKSPDFNITFPQSTLESNLKIERSNYSTPCEDTVELFSPVSTKFEVIKLSRTSSDLQEETVSSLRTSYSSTSENKTVGMLDRIGITLLADNWDNLFNSNTGDILVQLDVTILNVYKFVLTVRCPQIISEIGEDNKILWNGYSLPEAKAFFRYVYSGKSDHLWELKTLEKATVKRLARMYQLSHLEEVLLRLHDSNFEPNTSTKTDEPTIGSNNTTTTIVKETIHSTKQNSLSPGSSSLSECGPAIEVENSSDSEVDSNATTISTEQPLQFSPFYEFQSVMAPSNSVLAHTSLEKSKNIINGRNLRRSLEPYFEESFPEIPQDTDGFNSFSNQSMSVNLTPDPLKEFNENNEKNKFTWNSKQISSSFVIDNHKISPKRLSGINHSASSISSAADRDKKVSNISSKGLSLIKRRLMDTSQNSSPRNSRKKIIKRTSIKPIENYSTTFSSPEISSATKSAEQFTPNTSISEIVFSKNATPFPDYASMITPQLKKELTKFGIRGDLGKTKAKLLLKYIYDQTHPEVGSLQDDEDSESSGVSIETDTTYQEVSSAIQLSSDEICANRRISLDVKEGSEKCSSLINFVSKMVKNNEELFAHILLFKPLWLEKYHRILQDLGISCSLNDLKDALNALCIVFRSENNNKGRTKKISSKKSKKKIDVATLL